MLVALGLGFSYIQGANWEGGRSVCRKSGGFGKPGEECGVTRVPGSGCNLPTTSPSSFTLQWPHHTGPNQAQKKTASCWLHQLSIQANLRAFRRLQQPLIYPKAHCMTESEDQLQEKHTGQGMPSTKLSKTEEEALVQCITEFDSQGLAPNLELVRENATAICKARGASGVGVNWAYNFVKRTPAIEVRLRGTGLYPFKPDAVLSTLGPTLSLSATPPLLSQAPRKHGRLGHLSIPKRLKSKLLSFKNGLKGTKVAHLHQLLKLSRSFQMEHKL